MTFWCHTIRLRLAKLVVFDSSYVPLWISSYLDFIFNVDNLTFWIVCGFRILNRLTIDIFEPGTLPGEVACIAILSLGIRYIYIKRRIPKKMSIINQFFSVAFSLDSSLEKNGWNR